MKFKKSISLVLVMCMVLSLFASFVVSAEEAAEKNVVNVNVNENAMLTDGVTGFTAGWGEVDATKVALISNTKCTTQAMDVVVSYDLGEVKAINALALDFYHDANVMIGYPEGQILVEVSADGESWAKVGLFDIAEAEVVLGTPGTVSTVCEFNAVKAANVRATFKVGSSTGVLGDSPADGKVFWEFCSIAEVTVTEANLVEVDVSDYAQLTDGVSDFTAGWGDVDNTKVALISNAECKTNDMDVVVTYDLGEVKGINALVLDFYHCADVMIGYPQGKILVEVSVDGEAWSKVGLYDIAEAEVALGAPGTVSTVCEFAGRKAQYVRATFEVGASTGVLGDSPADGKVFWEFCSLAEISVTEATVDSPIVTAFNVAGYLDANDAYIFTDSDIYANTTFPWWDHVAFAPVEGKEGIYEVTEMIGGSVGEGKPVAIPEGGFAWIAWISAAEGTGATAKAVFSTISVGDYVQFTGLDIENCTATADATAEKYIDPNAPVNVALDKTYTLSGCGERDSYYAKLTDGVAVSGLTYNNTDWFGFYCNGTDASVINAPDHIGTVVIDLEEVSDLSSVRVNTFFGSTSGITNPTAVVLSVSEDGETFTEVETKNYEVATESSVSWITFDLEDVSARYVKLDFTLYGSFVFINEIEVYNVPVVAEPELEEVDGGDLPAHNPRAHGALTVPANTAISYTVAFENGANFNLYDETISVLVNGEALEFGMLGFVATLAKGDVVTIVNEGAEAVELYPSISEVIFGIMGNPIVLEELGDITANVTEAILSDDGAVHYVYTATVNGTLTITMPEGNWTYTVNNLTAGVYGDTQRSDSDPVLSTYTIDVAEGDEIQIIVGTYDPENPWDAPVGEVAFNAVEEEASSDPEADSKLSISDAIALGESKEHNTYTEGKYYVTGVITEVYNTTYGNMKITDENGNILTIYGTYGADGADRYDKLETKPVVGDTVTIYGIIGQYSGAAQIKNGWIVEHTPATPAFEEGLTIDIDLDLIGWLEAADLEAIKALLTDGKWAEDAKDWNNATGVVAIQNKVCTDAGINPAINLIWNFGEITKVNTVKLGLYANYNVMIGYPDAKIAVYTSANGKDWTEAGVLDTGLTIESATNGTAVVTLALDKAVETQFVKAVLVFPASPFEAQGKPVWEFIGLSEVEFSLVVPEDPEADSKLSISDAIALGESKDHNTYTEGKYYVTGVITEVYNTTYGNMKITDENGNILTIYGTYGADGELRYDALEVKPVVGDTVTIYGIIGQYSGAAQIKNGWIVEHTSATPELPEGATAIDILGYTHDAFNYIMYADADMTLGELVTKYYGQSKDLNYFKVIVVNEDGTIDAVYLTLGRPDGVKTDFTVKAGQIVIALSGNVPGYEVADSFKAGDTVVLHNIEIDTIKAATESTTLTGVGFTVVPYVKPVVNGTFAEEGLNGVNQFAANAHNIWTGSVASIEWWTKALLQWNDEAQGWEVLKVQGNGKVDWVTEGNQIVIAAHADNGAAVASIAALQVGDIVYIWDIGVATSDKLSADVDCNGGFYTTDATKTGTTAFTYKEKVALAGDVNMDGVINDADYMIIRKLVVGTADAADYTDEQLKLADVNGNGAIDANDYLVVKRHALGTYVIPAWK